MAAPPTFIKDVENRLGSLWSGGGPASCTTHTAPAAAAPPPPPPPPLPEDLSAADGSDTAESPIAGIAADAPRQQRGLGAAEDGGSNVCSVVAPQATRHLVDAVRLAQATLLAPLSRRLPLPATEVPQVDICRDRASAGRPSVPPKARFVKGLRRSELAALATLVSPWLPPPRQFCIDLTHIDLQWIVAKRAVPPLSLLTMPDDVVYMNGQPAYRTPSGNAVLLNSPRSVVALLRHGLDPLEFQKRDSFKCDIERQYVESRRVRRLQEMRAYYKEMCAEISGQEVMSFFDAYNPAEPSHIPDLDLAGETDVLTRRLQPSQHSGPGLYSETDVCYATLAQSLNRIRSRSLSTDAGKSRAMLERFETTGLGDVSKLAQHQRGAPQPQRTPPSATSAAPGGCEPLSPLSPAGGSITSPAGCRTADASPAEGLDEVVSPSGTDLSKPRIVRFEASLDGDCASDVSIRSDAGDGDAYGASRSGVTSRRAQQESHDPAFQATRLANVARRMDLRPLIRKMERTRTKMESMLVQDTEGRLQKVCDVRGEQQRKKTNMRNHEQRLRRVEERQKQLNAEKREGNMQQQLRRQQCAHELQVFKDSQLREKERKERSLMKRKDAAAAGIILRRKHRREAVQAKLDEKREAAKALESDRIEHNLRLIDEKEQIFRRVEERREAMQQSLREAGVAKKQEAQEARTRIEEHFKRQEVGREAVYTHKIRESERRIAALAARKVLARNTKAEMDFLAQAKRERRREEMEALEFEEHSKSLEEASERAHRFELRQAGIAGKKEAAAVANRMRIEDSRASGRHIKAVDEFRNLLTHGSVQWNTDRVNTMLMQVGIIKEKTRRAREHIYVEKESRMRALNDLAVKAEKQIYCETWQGTE